MFAYLTKRNIERALLVFVLIVVVGPFAWAALLSLQGSREINSMYALLIPRSIHFENYAEVLNSIWAEGMRNTLVMSIYSTVVNIVLTAPAAYALARVRFPLRRQIRWLMLTLIFLPETLLMVPLRQRFIELGMEYSLSATALPLATRVFSLMIFYRFYLRFAPEMDDAALLLGLGPFRCFRYVYLPVSAQPAIYVAMVHLISCWNNAFLPLFMYRGSGMVTAHSALLRFAMNPSRIYIVMAAVVLTCLPSWLLFFGRYLFRNGEVPLEIIDPFRATEK